MTKTIFALLALWMLAALPAAGQTWYPRFDDNGVAFSDGYALRPAGYPGHSEAHLKVGTGAVINSNTVNIAFCNTVTVCVWSDDYTGNDGEFFIEFTPSTTKSPTSKILADVDGNGAVDSSDNVPLDGDDGTNQDGDATARQTACMYGIAGKGYIWADQETQNATGSVWVEVSCQ